MKFNLEKAGKEKLSYTLDEFQKEAVLGKSRNSLIVAAPGSGKTTTIINRVKVLIEEFGINSDNIIVITFTKNAATSMKNRFIKENPGIRAPFFGTFHSLFYKILKRSGRVFDIIDSGKTFGIIKSTLSGYMDEVSEEKVKEILNAMSYMKCNDLESNQLDISITNEIFNECLEQYETYKSKNNLKDFDDLQSDCKELFLSNEQLLNGYRRLFKHILVDEFQDCDLLQVEILKLLNKENSIYAVGDEDQCIYSFRGSRPDIMVEFEKHFEGSKKYFLSTNYRCPKNVVNVSKKLIEKNINRNEKEILPFSKKDGDIKVEKFYNESNQANSIGEAIIDFNKNKGYTLRDNIVLYRTNIESRSLVDAFIRAKIPFRFLDKEYNFFDHFICKDIIAYLRLSLDLSNKESFGKIINKPFRYVGKNVIAKLNNSSNVYDCFEKLMEFDEVHPFQLKELTKVRKKIFSLNKYSLGTAVEMVLGDLGYHGHLIEYSHKYKFDINEVEEIVNEFKESSSEFRTIVDFLTHVEEVRENLNRNTKSLEDAVLLSTIHGVKGMEFPNVFIINCNEDILPHKRNEDQNIEEERRLMYVGVTRAIDNLFLNSCELVKGSKVSTSRFLNELGLVENYKNNHILKEGDTVRHRAFGDGKVVFCDGKYVEINFKKDNQHRKFDLEVSYSNGLIKRIS